MNTLSILRSLDKQRASLTHSELTTIDHHITLMRSNLRKCNFKQAITSKHIICNILIKD